MRPFVRLQVSKITKIPVSAIFLAWFVFSACISHFFYMVYQFLWCRWHFRPQESIIFIKSRSTCKYNILSNLFIKNIQLYNFRVGSIIFVFKPLGFSTGCNITTLMSYTKRWERSWKDSKTKHYLGRCDISHCQCI